MIYIGESNMSFFIGFLVGGFFGVLIMGILVGIRNDE